MLEAAVGAVWRWLTPPVLFVFVNLVIGTIAVMSRLMSASTEPGDGSERRSLMRAPSVAFDRLRCFSFSRLGLPAADHADAAAELEHVQYPALYDGATEAEAASPGGGEWRRVSLLRAPSAALDRLRGFSFSRRGPAADDALVTPSDTEPTFRPAPAEAGTRMEREGEREHAGIERSQSEAAAEAPARRRPRARRTRKSAGREAAEATGVLGEAGAESHELPPVEVDARADDFIRQFREQLRLQRLDSILRYKDTLRRAGTV